MPNLMPALCVTPYTQVTSWLGELEEKLSVKHRSAWPELKGWSDDGVMAPADCRNAQNKHFLKQRLA